MVLQNDYGDTLGEGLSLSVVDEDQLRELAKIHVLADGDDIRIVVQRIEDDPTVRFTVI